MNKQKLPDWEKVVDGGFGDKRNMYVWSMKKFNEYLYAGTASNINIFKSNSIGPGCQVWRISHL